VKAADARRLLKEAGGLEALEEALGEPAIRWGGRCHEISLKVLRTGILGPGRVARGGCQGVLSQHSWIILGGGPYDRDAVIADPTLWSYQDAAPYVHFAKNSMRTHRPHGSGSIWRYGHPDNCAPGKAVDLTWKKPPSKAARLFLELLGPLDKRGWIELAHYPVEDWPSGEIIGAIADTFGEVQVPIDILGMTTDRNPGGLYW
jgi:hypothetical protein